MAKIKTKKKKSHRERVLEQGRISLKAGRRVVPVTAGTKAPNVKNWPGLRLKKDQLKKNFGEHSNIGWILGAASGDLVDVDLDCPLAIELGKRFLPKTKRIHGRKGREASHYWYHVTPVPEPVKFTDIDGESLVEIRSTGQQTLIPPSIHPDGSRLKWDKTGEPARVAADVLQRAVARVAVGALLARHWPAKGRRHDTTNALAGMLLRAEWKEDEVAAFIEGVAEAAGDEESQDRVRDVQSTAKKLAAGGAVTGATTLISILGNEVVSQALKFLRIDAQATEVMSLDPADWPDPAPLGDELPPVQEFNLDFLPHSFRALVNDISDRMQAPPDYAAAAAVVALAGCVNRRVVIQPKKEDTSWKVVPNLWGAIIAPPGFMKTPILNAITDPLKGIEGSWNNQYEVELAKLKDIETEAKLRKDVWRKTAKSAIEDGGELPPPPNDNLKKPIQQRLVTTDATYEKLHEILSENPAGVVVIRDELTGWLAGLGRQGREGERGFYLEAWSGTTSYTLDRIGRGSIFVPAVCVSMFGNIQPSRLRYYLADTLSGGANDDGLFQRFQVMVYPNSPAGWELIDRRPNAQALDSAERVYSRLANLPVADPLLLRFAPDAQASFNKWLAKLEKRIRGDSSLAPPMVGHISKYRSLVPSLAGLFEIADRIAEGIDLRAEDARISLDHTQQAIAFCDYLESHAHRVYSCVVSPEYRAARELAQHIKRGDLAGTISTRDVYSKGWSGLDGPDQGRRALAILEDAQWVRRVPPQPTLAGGRPSETWVINPKVKTTHRS